MKKILGVYLAAAFLAVSCGETKFFPDEKATPTPAASPTVSPSPVPTATPPESASPTPTPSPKPGAKAPSAETVKANLLAIAQYSKCPTAQQVNGNGPMSYYKGMAVSYARALCHPERPEVKILSDEKGDIKYDGLVQYDKYLPKKSSLHNVYLILMGLGVTESSGKYCCGRDMNADFGLDSAGAEAGTFQASYGAKRWAPDVLEALFQTYKKGERKCYQEYYSPGITCTAANLKNWGTGTGVEWQKLVKECPAFGTEWAAVLIRKYGGSLGEFGPLRGDITKGYKVKITSDCDTMLDRIEEYTKIDGVCSTL